MLKLLLAVGFFAALGLAAALVPVRGATVLERWAAAPSTRVFLERGWSEAKVAAGLEKEKSRPARAATRPARPPQRNGRPAMPTEQHSPADRAELDRIIAESARP
jgi:hypothetical protein